MESASKMADKVRVPRGFQLRGELKLSRCGGDGRYIEVAPSVYLVSDVEPDTYNAIADVLRLLPEGIEGEVLIERGFD